MPGRALQITYSANAAGVLAAQKQIDTGHTKMQGGVSKTSAGFKSAFGSIIPISAAAAGVAVVALAGAVVNAASDEGEAINKAKVIFGDASKSVLTFGDTSASAFGISKAAALSAASGFGAMFDSAGLAEEAGADMSITMTKLAGDMASFNNEDPTDMLERLRSGLAGEAEPLRRFGVFISAARVETEAYASGIATVGEELTEAQKVQARFNLIMQDTAKQQGDFGRTLGESLPNQIRVLKAELTDLAAEIGTALLPALIEVAKVFNNLLTDIRMFSEAIGATGEILRGDREFTEEYGDTLRGLKDDFDAGRISVEEFREGVRAATMAEKAGASATDAAAEAALGATDAVNELTAAHEEATSAVRDQRLATLALSNTFLGIVDSANQVAEAQRELNRLEQHGKTDTKAYEEAVLAAIEAQFGLEESVLSYAEGLVDAGKKQRDVERAVRDAAHEMGIQKDAVKDLIGKIRDYIHAAEDWPTHLTTVVSIVGEFQEPSLGHVGAAHGFHGVVDRPTAFMVGEAGPERVDVTPGGGHGGGGGDVVVVVNVAGSVHDKEDLARTIRDEFVRLQRRNVTTGV